MGLSQSDRLKKNGIPTKKASVTKVPLDSLYVVTTGSTAHPRWNLDVEQSLIDYICRNGVPTDNQRMLVRESGIHEGGPVATVDTEKLTVSLVWSEKHANDQTVMLEMINGARRLKHGLIAQEILRETAPRTAPLSWDKDDPNDLGSLYVDVELFAGSDGELWIARLAANSDRNAKPDAPEVIALSIKMARKAGVSDGELLASCPRWVDAGLLDALGRWDNLVETLRPRFNSGEIPIQLLPAVLEAPRDKQEERAQSFLNAGVRSKAGATRMLNEERTQRSIEKGQVPKKLTPKQVATIVIALAEPAKTNGRAKMLAAGLSIAAGLPFDIPEEFKGLIEQSLKKDRK